MDSFDGFDKKSISDVDSLPLFIRFIDFSCSMFEVLNPNYSNSLDFHDQETFQPENTTSTIPATGQKEDLRQPFESSTKRDYSRY